MLRLVLVRLNEVNVKVLKDYFSKPEHVLDILSVGGVCSVDNTGLHNAVIVCASVLNKRMYENCHFTQMFDSPQ